VSSVLALLRLESLLKCARAMRSETLLGAINSFPLSRFHGGQMIQLYNDAQLPLMAENIATRSVSPHSNAGEKPGILLALSLFPPRADGL
jgi:hypothetical protein